MTIINGLGGPQPPARSTTGRTAAGGNFVLPDSAEPEAAGVAGAANIGALDGMLALQEMQGDSVGDRLARRRGHSILKMLTRLQMAQLGGAADEDTLQTLAELAEGIPPADDPQLAAVLQAVTLRARVELARAAAVRGG